MIVVISPAERKALREISLSKGLAFLAFFWYNLAVFMSNFIKVQGAREHPDSNPLSADTTGQAIL